MPPKLPGWDVKFIHYESPLFDQRIFNVQYEPYAPVRGGYTMQEWKNMNKTLQACTDDELKAELKRREEAKYLRTRLVWKDVMYVRYTSYNQPQIWFEEIEKIARKCGYSFFVVQDRRTLYELGHSTGYKAIDESIVTVHDVK